MKRSLVPYLAALLCLVFAATSRAERPLPERPDPAKYDQWQPQTDRSDLRLDRPVAAWESQIPLKSLLGQISQQTTVPLSAVFDLEVIPVTCFLHQDALAGVMGSLAAVFDGYWVYPIGEKGEERHYLLTTFQPPIELTEEYVEYLTEQRAREANAPFRAAREQRLDTYLKALARKPEEVIAEYYQGDPWVCVAVLEPRSRHLLECIAAFSAEQREALLSLGSVETPLGRLPAPLRGALREWWEEEVKRSQLQSAEGSEATVAAVKRFADPEEAWRNAAVWFGYAHQALSAQLRVPDAVNIPALNIEPGSTAFQTDARSRLARLGYGEAPTEEARQQESEAWKEAHPGWPLQPPAPRAIWLAGNPGRDRPLDLSGLPKGIRVNAALLLERVASQSDLNALSVYQPSPKGDVRIGSLAAMASVTLGDLADVWEAHPPAGQTALRLRGKYLLPINQDFLLQHAWFPSEEILAHWRRTLAGRTTMSPEELAALANELSLAQAWSLGQGPPYEMDALGARIADLRLYGSLTEKQRARLREEELGAAALDRRQLGLLLFQARRHGRSWMTLDDLKGTVLRLGPQTLPSGKEVLCLTAEYHVPGLPTDRDIVFQSARQLPIPEILRTEPAK